MESFSKCKKREGLPQLSISSVQVRPFIAWHENSSFLSVWGGITGHTKIIALNMKSKQA